MRHLTSLYDLSAAEAKEILALSAELKAQWKRGEPQQQFRGKVLTLLFEKPSLRTRVSFESSAIHLGGGAIFMSTKDAGMNGRESLEDVARVLSSYSDVIAMRTFSQSLIEQFSIYSSCPVINALSDDRHPCQALTDMFTLQEVFGSVKGRKIVYVGDGNNVATSLAILSAMLEMSLVVSAPRGYEFAPTFLTELQERIPAADVSYETDPKRAVHDADVVYTDVWASMGQENEAEERKKIFRPYQVNEELMAAAPRECKFMHDLPARRGMEVTDGVIDGPQSIVFRQAENRMHLAKGLLAWLMKHASKT